MTIQAVAAVEAAPVQEMAGLHPASLEGVASSTTSAGTTFGQVVGAGLDSVNQQLVGSEIDLQNLATGNVQNLHQVMIRLEETRLSFELFMQVRNRLLEAYQDIMKMQV